MSTTKHITKIAQMENKELIKCQNGEEFKINFITQLNSKPPALDSIKSPKSKRMTIQMLADLLLPRLDNIEARLSKLELDMANVKMRLDKQDILNNTFIDFMHRQEKFNNEVVDFMHRQEKFNDEIKDYMYKHL
ncbi:MAG: hypothetical protein LBV37_03370 [Mycoplasmataceae bacterium]|jgi:hypothetical protein|nr:hypothetical protein [Mycoplasmataceae bacterium]